jgi:hypothetical protein
MTTCLAFGVVLYLVMASGCSQLTTDNKWHLFPTDYQHTGCFSEGNAAFVGLGFFAALFLAFGFVGLCITVYHHYTSMFRGKPKLGMSSSSSRNMPEWDKLSDDGVGLVGDQDNEV